MIDAYPTAHRFGNLCKGLTLLVLLLSIVRLPLQAQCSQTIVPDTIFANDTRADVAVCVEFDYRIALRSQRRLDGVSVPGFADGCDYDTLHYYPFSTFPYRGANGPYRLLEWVVSGQSFSGTFSDIADLVRQMNTFDPGGNWTADNITDNLVGGIAGRRYGLMRVQHIADGTIRTVTPNIQAIANGTLVSARGAGWHQYTIFDPNTGCRDTLAFLIRPSITDIRRTVFTEFNTPADTQCLNNAQLLGIPQGATICGSPRNGTLVQTGPYCYVYTPNNGFSGSDPVCFSVCDDTRAGGPLCQFTFIDFITRGPQLPQRDTFRVTITNRDTTVCLNAFLQLGGAPDAASLCAAQPAGVDFVPSVSGCVLLQPAPGFAGAVQACVVHCAAGVCDTTDVFVTVLPACNFDIFPLAVDTIPDSGNPTPYCIPVSPSALSRLELRINGVVYSGTMEGCMLTERLVYNYAPLFGNGTAGPYTLLSWNVDGRNFNTSFADPAALANYMRTVDPAGSWQIDTNRFFIMGGEVTRNYGTMRIIHNATGTRTDLLPNRIDDPNGTLLQLPGAGTYRLNLLEPVSGCTDVVDVTVGNGVRPGVFREIIVDVTENEPSPLTCLFTSSRDTLINCGNVSNGTTVVDANTCVTYTPRRGFIGRDTFCMLSCTLPAGQPCDTTRVIFVVTRPQLPVDTIRVTSFGDSPFSVCAMPAFVGPYAVATTCGLTGPYVLTPATGACVTLDPDDGSTADGQACIRICAANDTTRCQTFIILISKTTACTPEVFAADTLTLVPQAGIVSVCLGDGVDLSEFIISLDGQLATTRSDSTCGTTVGGGGGGGGGGTQDVYVYNTFLTPAGSKRIDGWDIGGVLVSDVLAADYAALADSMSLYDPNNTWTFDPVQERILAGSVDGNYSPLILFDPGTGSTLILPLETTQIAGGGGGGGGGGGTFVPGTIVDIAAPGRYELTVVRRDSSCADRLFILRADQNQPQRDTLVFQLNVDQVGGPYCVDPSELSAAPTTNALCGVPQNGTLDFTSLACFTYTPAPGFVGVDSACVVICTANGFQCDTTFIRFVVNQVVVCTDIYTQTTASSLTTTCDTLSSVCLPDLPGEAFNFSLRIDGVAVTNAQACGADTMTVYSYADVAGRGNRGPYRVEGYRLPSGIYTRVVPDVPALVDSLNVWDQAGMWLLSASDFTIRGGVSGYAYDTLVLRQIATDTINRLVPVEVLFENQLAVSLRPGTYNIEVTDNRSGCTDVLTYTLGCAPAGACDELTAQSPLTLTVDDCDAAAAFVIATGSADAASLRVLLDGVTTAAALNGASLTVQVPVGTTTITVLDSLLNCSSEFVVTVSCDCAGPIAVTAFGRSVDCSAAQVEVCLPVTEAALAGYAIAVDGVPYTAGLRPCDEVETLSIDVAGLGVGPYSVDSFRIGNEVFSADVATFAALADSLSTWDLQANWRYDQDAQALTGGAPTTSYGSLFITEIPSAIATQLAVLRTTTFGGVALTLTRGASVRRLSFDNGSACVQEVTLTLACTTPTTINDTLVVDSTKLFCVETGELTGPVVTLRDICAESAAAAALDFDAQVGCVTVRAIAVGQRRACLVACDASGVCDTTYYNITVVRMPGTGDLDAVDDVIRIRKDERALYSITANDTFQGALNSIRLVTAASRGLAAVDADGVLSYVPTQGACGFVDTLTYEICQGVLCDRALVTIHVRCALVEAFTGFSPNGDGVNEHFTFVGIEDFPNNTLRVYNRWGNEVLVAPSYNNTWEGDWLGKALPDGTYFWLLEIDNEEPLSGFVQINR